MVAASRLQRRQFTVSTNHRVVRHWHAGILIHAPAVILRVTKPRRKWITVGILCPACGFHGNATYKGMQLQVTEAIANKHAS
jgi:hypothetical protein